MNKFKQLYLYILSKFTVISISIDKFANLLYLCDFTNFYSNLKSISNEDYICSENGPLAKCLYSVTTELSNGGYIKVEDNNITYLKHIDQYDLLSKQEKKLIDKICELWKEIDTKEIINYTHSQKPWMACRNDETIPYSLILQEEPNHVYIPTNIAQLA